ncbi:MAG: GNAT family N-acetyltransferase [Hydrogenophilales bacterium 16-64-46]|nr:MAG: GNAT family N-acetyltransferase [Hydrogenophilales bacterium 12-64-13]OYZ06533.1 MAG: GNAT family N-acetyltransferase [Hydrogenophilales bacterium 16-64-46]OZA39241.1 MAG: GNAT family N-acetyltransferase [Hydrogenophilales bacterium 17-64-34]HQS98793.1 GNAT family N-acetyltransferase [Thiobacillus sp.]
MTDAPRRLLPEEVGALAALARIVWQATYPALISQAQIDAMLADRYAAARIRSQLDDARHAWWVTGSPPAGFAHVYVDATAAKLDKLYVHPGRQRQGLGTALLHACADWARAQRCLVLRLQVNRGNIPAIRAYESYGFHLVESRVFDIGNGHVMDDHVMEITL